MNRDKHAGEPFWIHRLVGLASVLLSASLFFGLSLTGGTRYGALVLGTLGVCGTLFGMPLLVTGRLRQRP